jgi:pyruvate/2-oxoglutarate dehydrogenase complex dihydrolipoamide dehydrogenase (E3) component
VEVAGQTLTFAKAVLATGGRPKAPTVPGLEETGYLTNETVFNLTDRPPRLGVIGGGPIGCELAQAFQRLGSQVTLLHTGSHLLNKEDADAAEIVQDAILQDGVRLALSARLLSVDKRGAEKVLRYADAMDKTHEVTVDEILVAVGRAPNVEGLGLDAAGVAFDAHTGVQVNDYLRTTNRRIFAAGDVASRYQFTHAADFLARTVLANALFPGRQKVSALTIPWCTYTDPQIAHVGITEHQAVAAGIVLTTFLQPLHEVDRAILDGETTGFAKVHVQKGTDKILGATVVARHAGDMIGMYTMAMTHGLGLGSLAKVIQPYPTQAEAIRKTGDLYNRTRLTPRVKKLMLLWMRWRRGH